MTADADNSLLTDNELKSTPPDRTGFIYNPYSVFVYYKGTSNDGVIRFNDTIHYFNTIDSSVSFTFGINVFHENRPHTISLPQNVSENYIFYAIPKTTNWMILPDTLVVESMHKGIVELEIKIDEEEAYILAENGSGGLIGLVTATPSVSQNIGGKIVTSVPAYKVFIVLMPEKIRETSNNVESQGLFDDASSWMLPAILVIVIIVIFIVVLVKKIEYVEVEEEAVEK